MSKNYQILILLSFVLGVFVILNLQNTSLTYLSIHQIDEWAFFGSLNKMYIGFTDIDIRQYFSHGFLSYGHIFWAINFLVALPAFLLEEFELVIFTSRMISALFAILSLFIIYKLSTKYSGKAVALLVSLLGLTFPGFWLNGTWIHPDWMMIFFLLLSIYFLDKDRFTYSKYFNYAIIAYAVAVATKVQAISMLPIMIFYIMLFRAKRYEYIKEIIKNGLKVLIVTIFVFIALNPYLIHPSGLAAWISGFEANMLSNTTNHGTGVNLTFSDRLETLFVNYIEETLFYIASIVILVILMLNMRQNKLFILLYITLFIQLLYLVVFVNKDWQHYYLIFAVLFVILFNVHFKFKFVILIAMILTNMTSFYKEYTYIFSTKDYSKFNEQSNSLTQIINSHNMKNKHLLISSKAPISLKETTLDYQQIHYIWGKFNLSMIDKDSFLAKYPYKKENEFREKEIIIISKGDLDMIASKINNSTHDVQNQYTKSHKIILQLDSKRLGYKPFKENKYYKSWIKI